MPPVWPVVVDGSATTGTVWNKALHDAIKTGYIDPLVIAAINPGVYPGVITDEVVTARAAFGDLDARLDAIEAGLPPAGTATLDDVKRQQAQRQLARNSELIYWNAGAAAAPDYFVLSGAGASVARTGPGEVDATTMGAGNYAALVTSGGGAAAQLIQTVFSAADVTVKPQLRSRKVVFTARVQCASANAAKLVINDGVGTTSSAFHTGDGTVQQLSVVRDISAAATVLTVYLEVALGALAAYVGGFNVNYSDNAQALWIPEPSPWGSPVPISLGRWGGVNVATTGAGELDLWVLPGGIPANSIRQNGQGIEVRCGGTLANNANGKTVKLYVGAQWIQLFTTAGPVANNVWTAHVTVTRLSVGPGNVAVVAGVVTFGAATGAAPTVNHIYSNAWSAGGVDFAANQAFKLSMQGTAANDLIANVGHYIFLP